MPAGLYIHIPFCLDKCPYCDFYSVPFDKDLTRKFAEALKKEISQSSAIEPWSETTFSTLYIGGGTPTVLTSTQLDEILHYCFKYFTFKQTAERTVETNPETTDIEKLETMYNLGVNRLSIGFQSFHDDELNRLGRIHTAKSCLNAYQNARKAGYKNIGLDLIFAMPEQSLESWKETLKIATELRPEHISTYSLTIEQGTIFAKEIAEGKFTKLSEDMEVAMYEYTIDFLESLGYEHYEMSNFARPDFQSQHNQLYWDHSPYLGLGPSAHTFYDNRRLETVRDVNEYIERIEHGEPIVANEELLPKEKLMAEALFLALRKREGINVDRFRMRFGVDVEELHGETIRKYRNLNMLANYGSFLRLTRKGLMLANTIFAEFM